VLAVVEEKPEDATVYSVPRLGEVATYRSDVLKGNFLGKPMFVMLDGKQVSFRGARTVALDEDSPLRKLGLQVGDVLTRLDGVTVDTEKFVRNETWQMPELERHYGPTEVKWIKQGKHAVQVGQIDLGDAGFGAAETASLWDMFRIKLLPGFKNEQIQGIDSLPGKLVHQDGREIHYEIGRYYPPGRPRTGGAFENRALKSAEANRDITVKRQTIGELTFDVAQTANELTISTVSVPNSRGINFHCAAKTPAEVADALLMVLSLTAPKPKADVPQAPDN